MWEQLTSFLNGTGEGSSRGRGGGDSHGEETEEEWLKRALKSSRYIKPVKELLVLVPDADPLYLEYCCQFYRDKHVERVCEKLFQINHAHYPRLPLSLVSQPRCTASYNVYLDTLSELFPDCDASYLRDLITSCTHTVVYKAVGYLIGKNGKYPQRPKFGKLEKTDYFRNESYKKGALLRLLNLFPKVPKSSIKAILAETNHNFLSSHQLLSQLTLQNTWYNSFLSYLGPRKNPQDPVMYTLELLQELTLLENRGKEDNVTKDLSLARQLNQEQYDFENQTISCGCCYSDYTFEELAQCDEGHLFCKDCINKYVSEAVHGQSNFKEKGFLSCIDTGGCVANFSNIELARALEPELFSNFQNILLESDLELSNLSLVRCPFCRYVEADHDPIVRKVQTRSLFLFSLVLAGLRYLTRVISLLSLFSFPLHFLFLYLLAIYLHEVASVNILERGVPSFFVPPWLIKPPSFTILQCRAPECEKMSCRLCFQQCLPSHQCMEDEKDLLRLKVEQAMADAVKRTCPDCNLSFMKSDGCNKMTCRCGYVMCYLCREGIKDVSYGHFCEHFRFNPGEPCQECNKCDLYRDPNDDLAMTAAARRAKTEFLVEHPELQPMFRDPSDPQGRVELVHPEFIEDPDLYHPYLHHRLQNFTRTLLLTWFFH